jgi:hypothetical protein
MARAVMHLVHKNADGKWHLEQAGQDLGAYETKEEAERDGKKRGQGLEAKCLDAQLVVHRHDGSIETEWTYGHDPRKTPG